MSLDPQLLELMTQSITVAPLTGRDGFGKPTFGAGVTWKARVKGTSLRVQNFEGQQVVAYTEVWVGGVSGVKPDDQVTLPDGSTPPMIKVELYPDAQGNCFEKIYFGAKGRK